MVAAVQRLFLPAEADPPTGTFLLPPRLELTDRPEPLRHAGTDRSGRRTRACGLDSEVTPPVPDPAVGTGQAGAHSSGALPHVHPRHPRLDPLADRYAARTHGMKSSEIRALFSVVSRPEVVSLAGGMPAVTALPLDAVGSMIGELVSGMGAQTLQYGSGQGDPRLRERICDVMALEGITDAPPSEVVVTVGSQQGAGPGHPGLRRPR